MVELTKKLGAKPGADVLAVQGIGLDAGLVDNKSAAVDDDWQAVRFVYRKADRPR